MTSFLVYAGPNGSGKSSVRDAIANPFDVVIDPDRIARMIDPGSPRSVDYQAGRAAVVLFDQTLASRRTFSMETTLTGYTAVLRMGQAKAEGYEVGLVYVALSNPELNVFRVAERVRQGGHAIPPDTVRKRVGTSLGNLPRALAAADHAMVLDNSGPSYRRLLEVEAGRITFLAETLPQWLAKRMPAIAHALSAAREARAKSDAPKPPTPPTRGLISGFFDALRPAEPAVRPPWEAVPVPMAERVRAFEERAAKAREQAAKSQEAPEAEPEAPKPKSDPRP